MPSSSLDYGHLLNYFSPGQIYSSIWGADGHLVCQPVITPPPTPEAPSPLLLVSLGRAPLTDVLGNEDETRRDQTGRDEESGRDEMFGNPLNLHLRPGAVSGRNMTLSETGGSVRQIQME